MNYITTTELRTKSPDLVETLLKGEEVNLIHRSKLIGVIKPKTEKIKVFNAKRFTGITEKLNLPHFENRERKKRYRKAVEEKHGKSVY